METGPPTHWIEHNDSPCNITFDIIRGLTIIWSPETATLAAAVIAWRA